MDTVAITPGDRAYFKAVQDLVAACQEIDRNLIFQDFKPFGKNQMKAWMFYTALDISSVQTFIQQADKAKSAIMLKLVQHIIAYAVAHECSITEAMIQLRQDGTELPF